MCMSALLTTTNSFLDDSLFVLHQGSHPLEMTTALLVASLHHGQLAYKGVILTKHSTHKDAHC